jgi:hypothetical protein
MHGCQLEPPSAARPLLPPHVLGVPPPPQNCGLTQVVHEAIVPPHPSLCGPHVPAG